MSFRNKHYPLTADQKARGVIYSSELIVTNQPDMNSTLHEVMADDPERDIIIERLQDTAFFENMAFDFGWNVVNEIHS